MVAMLNDESDRVTNAEQSDDSDEEDETVVMNRRHAPSEGADRAEDDRGGKGNGKAEDKGRGTTEEESNCYDESGEEESDEQCRSVEPNPKSTTRQKSVRLNPRSAPRSPSGSSSAGERHWRRRSPSRSPSPSLGDGKDCGNDRGGRGSLSLRRPERRKGDDQDRGHDRGGKGSRHRSPRRPKGGKGGKGGGKGGFGTPEDAPIGRYGENFEKPEDAPIGWYGWKFEMPSVRLGQLGNQPKGSKTWRLTQVCQAGFGYCQFGNRCSFAHSRDELGKFMYKDNLAGFRDRR